MTIALISLAVLVALWLFFIIARRHSGEVKEAEPSCASCNGHDDRCYQQCSMEAAIQAPEYFDDEELDRFCGRRATDYDEEETEEFRQVLYTMQQKEVADWCRSLTLRGIEVPETLRDELFMLMED